MIPEIIDGKVVTRCSKCGEEIMSLLHKCIAIPSTTNGSNYYKESTTNK